MKRFTIIICGTIENRNINVSNVTNHSLLLFQSILHIRKAASKLFFNRSYQTLGWPWHWSPRKLLELCFSCSLRHAIFEI